ncbi:MAG TPA: lysylphosphatidylglycerol synthase domain-containing protein [Acetobacteraceae bacterium]|nr:lysylphosphatidylglycerol synthase domain-containing protein [Acetobacteraceae bacterium]
MKKLSIALALAGLLLGTLLIAWFGFGRVLTGVRRIGWDEFAVIIGWQLLLFVVLGLAWDAITPPREARRPWVFIWGRMVRDAATNCLPFSQVGGFVFGARAATLHGVSWSLATASTVVDVTAEFLAQLAFTAIGLGILLARAPDSSLAVPVEVGLGLAVMGGAALIWLQQGAAPLFTRLGRRIAGRWFDDAQDRVEVLQAELALIHGRTMRLAVGFFLHLLGWLGTGVAGWITYRMLGVGIDLDDALAIEALLSALAAAAFLVPVNAGVQEAGYAGLGAIFGVPPELSLAVSLVRRARDIAVGVPILLIWQFLEVRRLRAVQRAPAQR